MISRLVFILLLTALTACSGQKSEDEDGYEGFLQAGVWEVAWTQTMNESLTSSGLYNHDEDQIELLCPGYRQTQEKRETFWRQLLLSLSWKESLHGPRNWIRFNGGTNDGLFQINPELKAAYGCEGLDLFDAQDNIKCAVKMAKKLVTKYGTILTGTKGGLAAYWQPLRSDSDYNRRNRQFILDRIRASCQSSALVYHCKGPKAAHSLADAESQADRTFNAESGL